MAHVLWTSKRMTNVERVEKGSLLKLHLMNVERVRKVFSLAHEQIFSCTVLHLIQSANGRLEVVV